MEMMSKNYEGSKEIGQAITWKKFENDFLKQSIEGVKVIDSKGNVRRDVMYEDLICELDKRKIREIQYIPSQLAVKVLYINDKYDMLYRE